MVHRQSMTLTLTAEVPGNLVYRDLLGGVVAGVCRTIAEDVGLPDLADNVLTAFNEAFNNVVLHAYEQRSGSVQLVLDLDASSLRICLLDVGEQFRLADVSMPRFAITETLSIEDLPEGGMGVFLMRAVMDVVTYEAAANNGDRNRLTMVKHLRRHPAKG